MVDAARTFLFGEWDGVVLGNETSGWQEKYGRWGVYASRVLVPVGWMILLKKRLLNRKIWHKSVS